MKRIIILLILFAILASFFFGLFSLEEDPLSTITFYYHTEAGEAYAITPYFNASDGFYYVFSPDLTVGSISFSADGANYLRLDGAFYAKGEYIDIANNTNTELDAALCDFFKREKQSFTLVFCCSYDTPSVFIGTKSGSTDMINADKNYSEKGNITVLKGDGGRDYQGGIKSIHTRGNSTLQLFEKKPYTVKLYDSANILGMEAAESWCLVSFGFDDAYMRNKIIYDAARAAGVEHTSEITYVNLYLNGEYNGLYYLVQKITAERLGINDLDIANANANTTFDSENAVYSYTETSGYVNMPNEPEDISGGYLVEFDLSERHTDSVCFFTTPASREVVIKSPEYATEGEVEYIGNAFSELEAAILSEDGICAKTGKHYTEYLDLDSAVLKYLTDEISYNIDADTTSQYYYKKSDAEGGMIFNAPCWDYDLSLGSSAWNTTVFPNAFNANRSTMYENNFWYQALYAQPDFKQRVIELYKDRYLPIMNDVYDNKIQAIAEYIYPSVIMDKLRWGSRAANIKADTESFFSSVEAMKSFLGERLEFLSDAWINGTEYSTIYFQHGLNLGFTKISVPTGSRLDEKVMDYFFNFKVYYLSSTNIVYMYENNHSFTVTDIPFDLSSPITQDLCLFIRLSDKDAKKIEEAVDEEAEEEPVKAEETLLDILLAYHVRITFVIIIAGLLALLAVEVIRNGKRRKKDE